MSPLYVNRLSFFSKPVNNPSANSRCLIKNAGSFLVFKIHLIPMTISPRFFEVILIEIFLFKTISVCALKLYKIIILIINEFRLIIVIIIIQIIS